MCDVDKIGKFGKFVSLQITCDDDKFGKCGSLQNCKWTDQFGSLEVYKPEYILQEQTANGQRS